MVSSIVAMVDHMRKPMKELLRHAKYGKIFNLTWIPAAVMDPVPLPVFTIRVHGDLPSLVKR